MIASPVRREAGLKIMTETERRHKKAWEIWSPTHKTQVMFSNDKKRRTGSVIAEALGVGGHLFESRSKEPLSPALRKSLYDTSSTSANRYWQQLAQSRENGITTPIAKVNEPVKKLRKEAAKKPVQKARFRRTSCLGGDLYREQMFQARCKLSYFLHTKLSSVYGAVSTCRKHPQRKRIRHCIRCHRSEQAPPSS
jgi:hypothetical protein